MSLYIYIYIYIYVDMLSPPVRHQGAMGFLNNAHIQETEMGRRLTALPLSRLDVGSRTIVPT